MKAARDTYNQALRLVKDGKAKPTRLLKKLVVTRRSEDNESTRKMKETPANIRSRAVLDLIDAFKTAKAGHKARLQRQKTQKSRWSKKTSKKHKRKNGKNKNKHRSKDKNRRGRRRWRKNVAFHIKYKSKRCTSDSFGFESNNVRLENNQLFLFSRLAKYGMQQGIRMSEPAQHKASQCCRLQYHFGRWYFLLVYKHKQEKREKGCRIGALDPGIRTFQSYYSEDEAGEIGTDEALRRADHIIAKIKSLERRIGKECDPRKVQRLKKAWYRANARSSNLATDIHYKTIQCLFDRFDVIIAPRLSTASMLSDGKLNRKTKQRMRFYRHGMFYTRLLQKAAIQQKVVLNLEEHGTSKTCSSCGVANRRLGSSKTFWCPDCRFESDRDINSARNHLLKALVGNEKY